MHATLQNKICSSGVIYLKLSLKNITINHYIIPMNDKNSRRKNKTASFWVAVGAVILIILLIFWLTMADFAGDTDVAAAILPRF